MNQAYFEDFGAYVNAGHVDYYDAEGSKHLRLADITPAGDLVLTAEGEAFVQARTPYVEPAAEPELPAVTEDEAPVEV